MRLQISWRKKPSAWCLHGMHAGIWVVHKICDFYGVTGLFMMPHIVIWGRG